MKKTLTVALVASVMMVGCRAPVDYEGECHKALFDMRVYSGAISDLKDMGIKPTRNLYKKENTALYDTAKYCNLQGQWLKSMNYHIAVSDKRLGL